MNRRDLLSLKSAATRTAGGDAAPGGSSYTPIPTVTANVRRPDGRLGVMTVELGIDAADPAVRTRVTQSAPRLRAAYAAVIQQTATATLPGAPPDLERLVVQLQATTTRSLGRPGARVLIGTVMVV